MRRTVPVSAVAAVVALHTVAWLGFDVIDLVAVAEATSMTLPGRVALVMTLGTRAVAVGTLVLVGAVCYRVGREAELASSYGAFLRQLAVAGAVGGAAGSLALFGATGAGWVPSGIRVTVGPAVLLAGVAGVRGAVVAGVVGLAGGALGQFRTDTDRTGGVTPTADD